MITIKITKNQGENTVLEKPQGVSYWPPPSFFRVNYLIHNSYISHKRRPNKINKEICAIPLSMQFTKRWKSCTTPWSTVRRMPTLPLHNVNRLYIAGLYGIHGNILTRYVYYIQLLFWFLVSVLYPQLKLILCLKYGIYRKSFIFWNCYDT